MSTATHDERLDRRVHELIATDPQFAAAQPDPAITAALEQPGLRLPQIIRTVLDGYADRPALGQRVVEFVTDAKTGRTSAQLLPRFETITYSEVAQRVSALGRALSDDAVHPGDRVCVLGFNSVDYATIDMALGAIGAVSVPLQTSAAISSLQPIVAETEPTLIASSVNQLSDAVQLITGAEQAPTRLVVFDYHPQVDDQREAVQDAAARLSSTGVAVQTLAELLERGKDLPAVAEPPADEDSLALLIYTSGSTGAPKGAMYPQSNVGKMWRRGSKNWFGESAASITLNFMPMSHV
ncbi:AMP-binding protein, partial [Mycobacterium avium subsp. paratuberculosis 10-8425]